MKCYLRVLLIALVAPAFAVPYDANTPLVRDGRIVFEAQPSVGEYRLVLSAIRKVNGQWSAKQESLVKASTARLTVELDARIPFDQARQRLLRDMQSAPGMTVLFQCAGLDCGSSNGWANEFLRVKQLYGMDANQLYAVLAGLDKNQAEIYVVWYLVQRGNGRTYLQQDLVRVDPDFPADPDFAAEVWSQHWLRRGFLVLPGLALAGVEPQLQPQTLELLLNLLRKHPQLKLHLVGHDYHPGTFADRQRRSLFYAQWVRDRVLDRGVAPDRVTAHGLANLAPAARSSDARVEVVFDSPAPTGRPPRP